MIPTGAIDPVAGTALDFTLPKTIGRDIDSLERKEKLVKLAERRRGDREDLFADRASSLNVLKDRLAKKKIELEEQLKGMNSFGGANEYEARARLRLAARDTE